MRRRGSQIGDKMPQLPEPISHTVLAIWEAYEAKARNGDSLGVPMSQVANECERAIWYSLRWASPPEQTTGQKQRRFATGNIEEDRLLTDLENAGVIVERLDPATGQQFRVALANGWLRGKMDGRALNVPEAPKTLHVVEIKSHNDKSFKDLIKKKLQQSKPDHYAQCQNYMHAEHLTRCLYLAVNKNTDELYCERIEYDAIYAMRLEAKVERIVRADTAPPKLFEDVNSKAAFACGWCPAKAQCHEGEFARKNCRTCLSSSFEPGAIVRCTLLDKELSYQEQQAGCHSHLYLPSLVHGEQIDADEQERWVKYNMADGSVWVDGESK
jgi:hypothetical protein